MSSLWDAAFEKQKASKLDGTMQVCPRCNLPYPKSASKCMHCAHLTDSELDELRSQYNLRHNEAKVQRRLTLVWALVLGVILSIIFIIVM